MMRAVVITRTGGPEVLEVVEDQPAPGRPGPGELLVEVRRAGVNHRDVAERTGSGRSQTPPCLAGMEGVGVVVAGGEGVELAAGTRVAWERAYGSFAERVLVEASDAVALPDGMDDDTACAVHLHGLAAHAFTHDVYPVHEGDAVLVHGAAGSLPGLIVQLAKLRGATVIATASTGDKAEIAREAGADHVVNYDRFENRVRALTGGLGVHAVFDGVGRPTFAGSLAALRPRGTFVMYGAAGGERQPVDPAVFHTVYATRPSTTKYIEGEELAYRIGEVHRLVLEGRLRPRVHRVFPLEHVAAAEEELARRRARGKVLLAVP